GQLQQQPLGEVVLADRADQVRAQAEVAGGEGGVRGRTAGAQLAARQQLFGADLGPAVERAQDQVDADVADDAESGRGRLKTGLGEAGLRRIELHGGRL
ncbi:hypothetical protein CATMIT_01922, partial [Catenibacterium mitsuokai DSM 15897]